MSVHIIIMNIIIDSFKSSEMVRLERLRGKNMQVLLGQDLVDVKWKNRGGITRKIATGMLGDATAWRVSRADVDVEGPFSNFAGLTRILTVVSPNTMTLLHECGVLDARPWEPVIFDGGLPISSQLVDGPVTDLNLMFDPNLCHGTALIKRGPDSIAAPQGADLYILHVVAGSPRCRGQIFRAADTLFLTADGQAAIELGQGDAVLKLSITPIDQSSAIKLCIAER